MVQQQANTLYDRIKAYAESSSIEPMFVDFSDSNRELGFDRKGIHYGVIVPKAGEKKARTQVTAEICIGCEGVTIADIVSGTAMQLDIMKGDIERMTQKGYEARNCSIVDDTLTAIYEIPTPKEDDVKRVLDNFLAEENGNS